MKGMRQDMMKAMQTGTVTDRLKTRINMMEGMLASKPINSLAWG
jgi:hypothetical protein